MVFDDCLHITLVTIYHQMLKSLLVYLFGSLRVVSTWSKSWDFIVTLDMKSGGIINLLP